MLKNVVAEVIAANPKLVKEGKRGELRKKVIAAIKKLKGKINLIDIAIEIKDQLGDGKSPEVKISVSKKGKKIVETKFGGGSSVSVTFPSSGKVPLSQRAEEKLAEAERLKQEKKKK
jgi:hypothetical protein